MTEPLIKLKRTFEEAMSFRDSPQNSFYRCNGIQLLPNNLDKYIQVTDVVDGINLEDWEVFIVDLKSGVKTDVTESFNVESLTNDYDGNPQLYWSLTDVSHDFGYSMVYLEINQALGETFYSNLFMLTDYKKEKTTQFHYKESKNDEMQSIGIQSWFRQIQRSEELTIYYQTSTRQSVTSSQKLTKLEKHFTEVMALETLDLFMDILSSPYMYMDGVRASLYETPKLPDLKGDENFGQIEFIVCPNKNDICEAPQPNKGDFLVTDFDADDFNIYVP